VGLWTLLDAAILFSPGTLVPRRLPSFVNFSKLRRHEIGRGRESSICDGDKPKPSQGGYLLRPTRNGATLVLCRIAQLVACPVIHWGFPFPIQMQKEWEMNIYFIHMDDWAAHCAGDKLVEADVEYWFGDGGGVTGPCWKKEMFVRNVRVWVCRSRREVSSFDKNTKEKSLGDENRNNDLIIVDKNRKCKELPQSKETKWSRYTRL